MRFERLDESIELAPDLLSVSNEQVGLIDGDDRGTM
jgi:hypothetical protein